MEYVLTSVEQSGSIRHYAFAELGKDFRSQGFSVSIDIEIVRKYRIPLQELPLICSNYLTAQRKTGSQPDLIYGEAEMIVYCEERTEAARVVALRKTTRKNAAKPHED